MSDDWVEILATPLSASAATAFVADPRAGGIDIFLGTTRAEMSAQNRELMALDYEAYAEMALPQMQRLCQRARDRWPIIKIAMLHRTGRVNLAEPSVIIAVSTPHRAES